MTRDHLLFVLMCAIWGLTWIAIRTGVEALPPLLFASLRFVAAGLVLLGLARVSGAALKWRGRGPRLLVAAFLVNTACYGSLFWGMQFVPSGLAAVVNLALIPLGLFTIGLALGEERFSRRRLAALLAGVGGLVLLFVPKLSGSGGPTPVSGLVAIVAGTLAYCLGSILSRPLLRELDPLALSAQHNLIGGTGLLALSLSLEPVSTATLRAALRPEVIASWAFLVLAGSVAAFTIYLQLLRDWGPSRAGAYAFVSPVVALAVGAAVFGERPGLWELAGGAVLLASAALATGAAGRPGAARPEAGPG